MIPTGVYVLMGVLGLTVIVEAVLLYKFKKDRETEVPAGGFFREMASTPNLGPSPASSSFFKDSHTPSTPDSFKIDRHQLKDAIAEGNPFWTSFLYFILAFAALLIIGFALRFIFEG